jgi:hypothetical protein
MGEVYRARDTRLGCDVAIKVLPAHLAANPEGRARFVAHGGYHLDVFGIDVQSGTKQLWKTFEVHDPAGVRVYDFVVTRDARSYAYGYMRFLDELYLVEGLK